MSEILSILTGSSFFKELSRFDELFSEIGEGVGAAKHFYVPTLRDFFEKAVPSENKKFFHELFLTFEADINSNFYAGGVFLYKNSDKNRELISKVLESYDSVYKDSDGNYKEYIQGVTDEVFLSAIAEKEIIDLLRAHGAMTAEELNADSGF